MNNLTLQYPGTALRHWLLQQWGAETPDTTLHMFSEIADTLFFAGLAKEEGQSTHIRVVFHPNGTAGLQKIREDVYAGPAQYDRKAWETIPFERESGTTDFTVKALTKLAPAANQPRTSIIVGPVGNQLQILGIARRVPPGYFLDSSEDGVVIFHSPEPGQLTVSIRHQEVFRYERGNLVSPTHLISLYELITNKQSPINSALTRTCTLLLDALKETEFYPFHTPERSLAHAFHQLIRRMGIIQHGGLIVITQNPAVITHASNHGKYRLPIETRGIFRDKLKSYAMTQAALTKIHLEEIALTSENDNNNIDEAISQQDKENAAEEFQDLVDNIGQLTAVDNALVIGPNLDIVCAGYQLPTQGAVPRVFTAESMQGSPSSPYHISQHGARHRAASSFANEHPDSVVFVASQDGPVRCLHRPLDQEKVFLWNVRLPEY